MDLANPKKQIWQDRVVAVREYHLRRLSANRYWSVRDTAKELNRSLGSISQDIQLADFLRTYNDELGQFKHYVDALEWLARKKIQLRDMK